MRSNPRGPGTRAAHWLVAALLGLLAFAVRALPYRNVFVGGEVFPFGNDAWYHLRRIAWSVVRFPEVLGFDRYINFPDGAKPIWPPAFDWGVALLVRPFFRPGDLSGVERAATWVPPALGAATVVVLFAVARRQLGTAVASLSAAFLCVLPAHFWYSQVGFVDHHAAVALCTTALLGAAMRFTGGGDGSRFLRPGTLGTGFLLAVSLLIWPGSLLHVFLVDAALMVFVAGRDDPVEAVAAARSFAAAHLLAALLVLPFGAGAAWAVWGDLSPVVLSRFQPWLFAGLGVGALACAGLWTHPLLAASRSRRIAAGLALGALLVLLALAAEPDLRAGLADAWRWMTRAESFQAGVGESQPLFVERGAPGVARALERLSGFVLVFPFAWLAAVAWAWRRAERAPLLLWLFWSAGLFAATLVQRRFFNSFSVSLALLMGWSLWASWRALPALLGARLPVVAARAGLVGLTVLLLLPTWSTYRRDVFNALRTAGEPWRAAPTLVPRRALVEMGRWIGRRTPPTRGWLDPTLQPEYGILAPWELGHALEYVARRPTVTDNFGDDIGERNFRLAREYWRSPEPEASAILDELGARYVVASLAHAAGLEAPPDSVAAAIHLRRGSAPDGSRPGDPPALERHRLVYESRVWGEEDVDAPPLFQIYEHVAGARIAGRSAPGTPLEASVTLETNRGRELVHRARTRADAEGRFTLRVPYANRGAPPAVRVGDHYRIRCPGGESRVVISEAAVRAGARVEVLPLCLGSGAVRDGRTRGAPGTRRESRTSGPGG